MKNNLLSAAAVFGLLAGLQTGALSQENQQSAEWFHHDEIVVTARKREELIQQVPLAISAFTANQIISSGIQNMTDVAKLTPGFSLDEDFGRFASSRPVIRGQSTIFGASGVSTFVDGVLINGSLLDYDLGDVERIEVIRGPQSALYGRNTYSGAINVISKSPSDEFSGSLLVDAGSFERFETAASIRGPLTDTLSASLTGRHYSRSGPFTNAFDGTDIGNQQSSSVSAVLFYEPSEKLSIRSRIRFSHLDDDQFRNFNTPVSMNNVFQDVGGVYNGNFRYFAGEITAHPINIDDVRLLDQKGFDRSDNVQGSISVNYQINENWNLELINGVNFEDSHSKADVGNTPNSLNPFAVYIGPAFPVPRPGPFFFHGYVISGPVADLTVDEKARSANYSSELRLHYADDRWNGMIGGYVFDGQDKSQGLREAPTAFSQIIAEGFANQTARMTALCAAHARDAFAPCLSVPGFNSILNFGDDLVDLTFHANRSLFRNSRQNLALFGSVGFEATDQLELSAEVRYASERIEARTIAQSAVFDYTGLQTGFTSSPEVNRNATFTSFNPRFTAKFSFTDSSNFYAVAARGSKPGGFNGTNVINQEIGTFDEETVWGFELGSKNSFRNGSVIFNFSAYHNTISGYQLSQAILLPAINQTTSVITNLGKVRITGLEAELFFKVSAIPGLGFNVNYALADSSFLQGTDITQGKHLDTLDDGLVNCSIGLANPAAACANGDNVIAGSIVGRALPRAPKHMLSIGMNYTQPISSNVNLIFGGDVNYESKKFVQVHNLAYFGEALMVNARIGFETDSLRATFYARNITQEDSVVSAFRYVDEAASFQRAFAGAPRLPRAFGVTVRKTF